MCFGFLGVFGSAVYVVQGSVSLHSTDFIFWIVQTAE